MQQIRDRYPRSLHDRLALGPLNNLFAARACVLFLCQLFQIHALFILALITQLFFLLFVFLAPLVQVVDWSLETFRLRVDLRLEWETILGVQYFLHLLDDFRPVLDQVLADDFDFILAANRSARLRIGVFDLAQLLGCLVNSRLTLEWCFD